MNTQHTSILSASLTLLTITALGCTNPAPSKGAPAQSQPVAQGADERSPEHAVKTHGTFDAYWYQGLAELTRYELKQSRYGQIRQGEAVFVYVTEEFSDAKQVKADGGKGPGTTNVLKLNQHRRFETGIYPYSVLTSSFVPAKGSKQPLKVVGTVQEWCGQTFMQLNHRDGAYDLLLRSYFESEGDQSSKIAATWTEDGLLALVRRDPNLLPTGTIEVLPGFHDLRMRHKPMRAQTATATLRPLKASAFSSTPHLLYTLDYTSTQRHLQLYIEAAFPHRVLAWQESQSTALVPGERAEARDVTQATLTRSMLLDYWNKNSNADAPLAKTLRTPAP